MTPSAGKTPQLTEAQRYGLALKRLRLRYDMSQRQAAEAAGTYQQNWQRYERGENDALLKPVLQRRLAEGLGASHEEFLVELAQVNADPAAPAFSPEPINLADRIARRTEFPLDGRMRPAPNGMEVFDSGEPDAIDLGQILPQGTRFLRLAGEDMIPYAEPGGYISYNPFAPPQRGRGCVIRMTNGAMHVKKFLGMRDGQLQAIEYRAITHEGRPGYVETPVSYDLRDVEGVFLAGIRGD